MKSNSGCGQSSVVKLSSSVCEILALPQSVDGKKSHWLLCAFKQVESERNDFLKTLFLRNTSKDIYKVSYKIFKILS